MKNHRGTGADVVKETVVAAGARTSGQAVVEENFHGFCETNAALGESYTLRTEGEYEIDFIASSVKGDTIAIHPTTFALSRFAFGTAITAGLRAFAKVTAVPGTPPTHGSEPKTGKMWVRLLPQPLANAA